MRFVRRLLASSALTLVAAHAGAQQPSTVTNMQFASTPFDGSELLYLIQRGNSRKTNVSMLGQQLFGSLPAGTVLGNAAGVPGLTVPLPVPSCSTGLTWASGSGFGCATSFSANTAFFSTKSAFQASSSIPASWVYVTVGAVSGSYPPASGLDATSLTYHRVNSSTGLFGEITVAGVIFDPIYSTSPVNTGQFGDVADGVYASSSLAIPEGISIVCSGSSATCTTSGSTTGMVNGQLVGLTFWHSNFNGATWTATGTGTTATVTGSWIGKIPVGDSVTIAGMTPSGYNGTFTVTASSVGSVSFANATTAAQTVSGMVTLGSALPIPPGTTVASFVASTSVTLSITPPAGTYQIFSYAQSMTGTCDEPFIQAAINFALQFDYPVVRTTNGFHHICNTPQVGWGNSFYQLQFLGSGTRASSASAFPSGTTFLIDYINAPGMNFQGMRNGQCSGVSLLGKNQLWAQWTQNFPSAQVAGGGLSADALDWLDPALYNASGPGGIQTNTPYAGITIDAYSGSQPGGGLAYPALTFPAFTGLSTQYNRLTSSDVDVGGCEADGFGVGFISGANTNNQGDFLKLDGFETNNDVYGIVISNGQSRVPRFSKSSSFGFHTYFSNDLLGIGGGELAGTVSDLGSGGFYQMFHVSGAVSGPTTFRNLYCERCVRIGVFSASTDQSEFTLEDGLFNFNDYSHLQEPTSLISGNADIKLNSLEMNAYGRLIPLTTGSGKLTIDRGRCYFTEGASPSAAVQIFASYSGGCFAGAALVNSQNLRRADCLAPFQGTYWVSGSWTVKYFCDDLQFTSPSTLYNRVPIDQYAIRYTDNQNWKWDMAKPNPFQIVLTNTGYAGVAPSMSSDVLSFGYCAVFQSGTDGPQAILAPGDGLYQADSNTLFVVTTVGSITGNGNCTNIYPITAQQQNNMLTNPSYAWTKNNNSDPTIGGTTFIIKASIMAPLELFYGAVSSSCAFSTVSLGDGTTGAATIGTYLTAGDVFFGLLVGNPYRPWYVPNGGATLGAITSGAIAAGTGSCTSMSNVPIFPVPIH